MPETPAPDDWGLSFDHFGLATRDAARSMAVLRGLGYVCSASVYDPLQNVHLVYGVHPRMPAVELIYAAEEPGPLESILVHQPESVYHLCFRSADVAASMAAMKAAGHRVLTVVPPRPAVLFGHRPVSFHLVKGLGLVEFIETDATGPCVVGGAVPPTPERP